MKKLKKYVKDTVGVSMIGSAGAIGLGGIGGTVAHHGQAGVQGATRFLGTSGNLVGASTMIGMVNKIGKRKRKKR